MVATRQLTGTADDWHYLREAQLVSRCSDDPNVMRSPKSAVGAVIADENGLVAASANIIPPPLAAELRRQTRSVTELERYHFIEHAERAAIYKALLSGRRVEGATIYCTRFACADCARAIAWSGIRRGVFASGLSGETRWLESQAAALQILKGSGIEVDVLNTYDQ